MSYHASIKRYHESYMQHFETAVKSVPVQCRRHRTVQRVHKARSVGGLEKEPLKNETPLRTRAAAKDEICYIWTHDKYTDFTTINRCARSFRLIRSILSLLGPALIVFNLIGFFFRAITRNNATLVSTAIICLCGRSYFPIRISIRIEFYFH